MTRPYLDGPVLLGFAELFDRSYGDPTTLKPYATISPAKAGDVLLPFPCPRCEAVQDVDKKTRENYRDPVRGHSWCTACGLRYHFDANGTPLEEKLGKNATSARPAVIKNGELLRVPSCEEDVFALVGVY